MNMRISDDQQPVLSPCSAQPVAYKQRCSRTPNHTTDSFFILVLVVLEKKIVMMFEYLELISIHHLGEKVLFSVYCQKIIIVIIFCSDKRDMFQLLACP